MCKDEEFYQEEDDFKLIWCHMNEWMNEWMNE